MSGENVFEVGPVTSQGLVFDEQFPEDSIRFYLDIIIGGGTSQ